ncbi:MAG: hypothetical protein RLZZ117_1338, partial [Cyanobacteriota bacterium]
MLHHAGPAVVKQITHQHAQPMQAPRLGDAMPPRKQLQG